MDYAFFISISMIHEWQRIVLDDIIRILLQPELNIFTNRLYILGHGD